MSLKLPNWNDVNKTLFLTPCALLLSCAISLSHAKTTMIIVNNDGAGEGFNDPTPVEPVGGNTGTTVGEQRLIALQYAADLIGLTIHSEIPISISAEFTAQGGNQFGGMLASAGPAGVLESFEGAPESSTWYPSSLANKLAGRDFSSAVEVEAEFNSDVDGDVMLGSNHWYYGLDANPSGGDVDFVTVALHELIHGFGFLSLIDIGSGQKFGGRNDIYTASLERQGASTPELNDMSNQERASAVKATGSLYWNGNSSTYVNNSLVNGNENHQIEIYAPNPVQYGSSTSHFSTSLFPNNLMEPSYEGANHSLGVATVVLSDMGWGSLSDLAVSLSGPETVPNSSNQFQYQAIVSNVGSEDAAEAQLEYQLPSNAQVLSAVSDQGTCSTSSASDNSGGITVTCQFGTLNTNGIATVDITAQYSGAAQHTHTAQVFGDIVEERTDNNRDAVNGSLISIAEQNNSSNPSANEQTDSAGDSDSDSELATTTSSSSTSSSSGSTSSSTNSSTTLSSSSGNTSSSAGSGVNPNASSGSDSNNTTSSSSSSSGASTSSGESSSGGGSFGPALLLILLFGLYAREKPLRK